jgi:hypothetical protein
MELNLQNMIWSKGPIRNHYSTKPTEYASPNTDIIHLINSVTEQHNIIFIRNGSTEYVTDLFLFATNLELLKHPIILITSDGDRSMLQSHKQSTIQTILNSDKVIKWYTQNYDKSILHPKLKHYPIGFDLHTASWFINNSVDEKIKFMVNMRKSKSTESRVYNKILSDTHNSITHQERIELFNTIKKNPNIDFVNKKIPFNIITEIYNNYNFVISPRGNGLDCHRTWELFLAGVIVITKTSSLDEMYTQNNLPVIILKDWSELNDNLECKLEQWYNEHIDKTKIENIFERLTFNYWLNT